MLASYCCVTDKYQIPLACKVCFICVCGLAGVALLILAGCGPLLGVQLGAGWSVGTLGFPPHGLFICSCPKLLIELRLFRRKNGSTRGLLKPRLQINTAWLLPKQVTESAQIKLEVQAPSLVERSFQVTLQGAWRAKEGEKWGHFSNQSAGFPARRSLACTVSLYFSPSLFPPSTSSQNFYSLNFLVALVMELNQLSVPASVCWNSQSLVTSWWVRLWSMWALPRVLLCLIFSFVSGVAEVKIWCYFLL